MREDKPPLYPLLPQYYDEQGADSPVVWVPPSDEDARSQMRMRVYDGLVMDHTGCTPLHGDDDSAARAIFVLDQTNEILLTVDYEHNKFHHSSFVAGAPVIAAGEMIISRGRLIALTNHSGHYLPPPSCISYVMDRLEAMGVANLATVELELIKAPAMLIE